jgi:aminomethyltransferase
MTDPTRSIPFEALHRALGARMGAFAGYQMPIQYPDGLKAEHVHTRTHADCSTCRTWASCRARP